MEFKPVAFFIGFFLSLLIIFILEWIKHRR